MNAYKWRWPLLWAALVIALDLATKWCAARYLSPWEPLAVTGFFNLVLAHNSGAAFSLFEGEGGSQGLKMALLALVSVVPFLYFYVKAKASDRAQLISLGLIWGGALGNIHDRLRWGAVVDFLDFHAFGRHWPAFNVADIAICVGGGLLAICIFREPGP